VIVSVKLVVAVDQGSKHQYRTGMMDWIGITSEIEKIIRNGVAGRDITVGGGIVVRWSHPRMKMIQRQAILV